MESNYLAHYGVLGMKWGVRKQKYAEKKKERVRKLAARYSSYEGRVKAQRDLGKKLVLGALATIAAQAVTMKAASYFVDSHKSQLAQSIGYILDRDGETILAFIGKNGKIIKRR